MTLRRFANIVIVGVAAVAEGRAQQPPASTGTRATRVVAAADRHDVSRPLRDMPAIPPAAGPTREIPRQSRPMHVGPRARSFAPDPVAQTYSSASLMPAAAQSFDGIGNVDGVLPPDSNGAVGPNHYVQWVNLSFAIFRKESAPNPPTLIYGPAAGNTLWQGFGGACEATNNGDPVVRYDHFADRWFMSQLAIPNMFGGIVIGPFYQCIAVSATPDPTGAYYRYQFQFDKLNDYPKFGVWPDAYYMTMNQFSAISLQWAGQGVVAYERQQMLAGLPARMIYFDLASVDMNLGGMLPADVDGPPPPRGAPEYFAQVDDDAWGYAPDQLQIWQFHVDWTAPSSSTFTGPAKVATAPFDSNLCGYSGSCIPQPHTTAALDPLSDRLMYRLEYRNFGDHESLVVNHTVDADGTDHAGVRWYEVRAPGGAPTIFQQGTYAPDANGRWMASAAMDGAGDIALGFSVSGQATAPSIRYTGRLATDPPGTMTQGEAALVAGAGSQTSSTGRWGDYSMLVVDPIDDCTFWYTQEYYAATSDSSWRTRIGSFAFPACRTPALPAVSVVASVPRAAEAGPAQGAFTLARTGDTSAPLTVSYTVGGTATPGADYVALHGTVMFAAGQTTTSIAVEPIDDAIVEPAEIVDLTIDPDPSYRVGVPAEAIVTIASDDAPPNLVVSAMSAPATAGAGSAILVTDTTTNQGSVSSTASQTGFYLSTDASIDSRDVLLGSRSVPSLSAGSSDAGATSLIVPAGTSTGTYYVIAAADYNDAVYETLESDNTRSAVVRIGPDLTVSTVTAPPIATAGGSIVVSDTTANPGGGTAAASTTSFYLSSDVSLDSTDRLVGSRTVASLAPGATSSGSVSVDIRPGTPAGTYYLFAKADAADQIAETSESNNTAYTVVRIGPDLVVPTVTAPSTVSAGQTILVTDTTKNQGAGAADASTTGFYLSPNFSLDSSDVLLGSRAVPSLAAGASSVASTSVQIPAGTAAGTYFLFAKADANAQVVESVESNNEGYAVVRIGPDLVAAVVAPGSGAAGQAIVISDTTKNQGAAPADASITAFYLSTNSTIESTDVLLGSRSVPALVAGASSSASTSVLIPSATATGTYFLLIAADANHQVAETDEANNVAVAVIRIGPDLVVSAVSAPSTVGAGQTIVITDTTRNQGAGAAAASTTFFYLSTNLTVDASDVLLGSRAVATIAPGASSPGATSVQIPAGVTTGTYYVLALADGASQVIETDETNNVAVATVQIGSDLTVSDLTAPSAAAAGQTIVVTDTTKNQGSGVADASTTTFYLSADFTLDAIDVVLGSRAVPLLSASAASSGSTSVQIPVGTRTGTYYLFAKADATNQLPETNESNNTASVIVRIGPDLVVSTFTAPFTAGGGQAIIVNDTTQNQGAGGADASTTGFYLSANSTLDAGDLLLATRSVPALAAGGTSTGSTAVQIPSGTMTGTYYLIAAADAATQIAETSESNNVAVAFVRIGPDLTVSTVTVPPTTGAGRTIILNDVTSNQGAGAADASSTSFYLSTNFTLDASDVLLGSRAVPALAPGATNSGSISVQIPSTTSVGTYFIVAAADANAQVTETNETNNTTFAVVRVGPDLVVSTLTVPASAVAGTAFVISDTTANQGGDAAGASTTQYYLSTDLSPDSGDVLLGGRPVPALAAAAGDSASVTLTVPASTPAGNYYLIAVADGPNVVAEPNETNNSSLRAIKITVATP